MNLTEEQQEALDQLRLRLAEWDEYGEREYSAVDFAVVCRVVVEAFKEE